MYTGMGAVLANTTEHRAALPACYNNNLQQCLDAPQSSTFPNCSEINALYDRSDDDWDTMESLIDEMPYCTAADCCADAGCTEGCPGTSFETKLIWGGLGAVGGIILTGIVALAIQ